MGCKIAQLDRLIKRSWQSIKGGQFNITGVTFLSAPRQIFWDNDDGGSSGQVRCFNNYAQHSGDKTARERN